MHVDKLDAPHFDPSLARFRLKQCLRIRKRRQQSKEFHFVNAVAVCAFLISGCVALTGFKFLHDLVVAKVVGPEELEIFEAVFSVKRESHLALKDHKEFVEHVALCDDRLRSHEEAAVELGNKVGDKLFAADSVVKFKHMLELLEELREQFVD